MRRNNQCYSSTNHQNKQFLKIQIYIVKVKSF